MRMRVPWIVKHPIQTKYLLIVLVAMLVPTLLIGLCLYHLVFRLLASQIIFPEAIASTVVPVIERVNGVLAVTLPLVLAALTAAAIAISHRFGGPIERLESDLDRILSGDLAHRIQMRPDDDLGGVARRINALAEKLRR